MIRTLDALLDTLRNAPSEKNSDAQMDYAVANGLPVNCGEIDWSSLPTFGGTEPANTVGVWSWDATRMLVGAGRDTLRIALRSDVEG